MQIFDPRNGRSDLVCVLFGPGNQNVELLDFRYGFKIEFIVNFKNSTLLTRSFRIRISLSPLSSSPLFSISAYSDCRWLLICCMMD